MRNGTASEQGLCLFCTLCIMLHGSYAACTTACQALHMHCLHLAIACQANLIIFV